MNDAGALRKNFANPPIKDTVQITGGGYAIIRFRPTPGINKVGTLDVFCVPPFPYRVYTFFLE